MAEMTRLMAKAGPPPHNLLSKDLHRPRIALAGIAQSCGEARDGAAAAILHDQADKTAQSLGAVGWDSRQC